MGISTFPNIVSPIKSIQRGTASAAGNITISAVNLSKTMVNSFSTSSDGTVAASGTIASFTGTAASSTIYVDGYSGSGVGFSAIAPNPIVTGNYNAPNIASYNVSNASYNSPTQYFTRYAAPYNAPTLYYNTPYASSYNVPTPVYANNLPASSGNMTQNSQALNLSSTNISGGSNNLVSANYGVYLSNSTTLVATGPCRYEVVEYY